MDGTGYFNYPLGARTLDDATLDAFALPYATIGRMMRDWALIASNNPTWGAAKPDDGSSMSKTMGDWTIKTDWGEWQFGQKDWTWLKSAPPAWANEPVGGVAVAQLSDDTFLVIGDHVRVTIAPSTATVPNGTLVSVEEGYFDSGRWIKTRVWNGDQTDYGLNLLDRPVILKVTMGHYR